MWDMCGKAFEQNREHLGQPAISANPDVLRRSRRTGTTDRRETAARAAKITDPSTIKSAVDATVARRDRKSKGATQ
jgi:hypothetical protein